MVRRDERRRPRGDEGAMSSSGWEAMRPLNASDRVEDVQVENALDAPLRRGVELARLALVASLGGFARGYDAVVAATAVAQARDEFSAGRWLDYTAPGVAALGALAGAAFGGVASFSAANAAFVCDALFIAGACLALSAPGALTFALARLVAARLGASAANAPAFLLELAPRNIRGGVVAARRGGGGGRVGGAISHRATRTTAACGAFCSAPPRSPRRPMPRACSGCPSRPRGSRTRGHAGGRARRAASGAWRTSRRRRGRGSRRGVRVSGGGDDGSVGLMPKQTTTTTNSR